MTFTALFEHCLHSKILIIMSEQVHYIPLYGQKQKKNKMSYNNNNEKFILRHRLPRTNSAAQANAQRLHNP